MHLACLQYTDNVSMSDTSVNEPRENPPCFLCNPSTFWGNTRTAFWSTVLGLGRFLIQVSQPLADDTLHDEPDALHDEPGALLGATINPAPSSQDSSALTNELLPRNAPCSNLADMDASSGDPQYSESTASGSGNVGLALSAGDTEIMP